MENCRRNLKEIHRHNLQSIRKGRVHEEVALVVARTNTYSRNATSKKESPEPSTKNAHQAVGPNPKIDLFVPRNRVIVEEKARVVAEDARIAMERWKQFASVNMLDPWDKKFNGGVELENEGGNCGPKIMKKICLETGTTETVVNLNNFETFLDLPLLLNRYVKLADARTLNCAKSFGLTHRRASTYHISFQEYRRGLIFQMLRLNKNKH